MSLNRLKLLEMLGGQIDLLAEAASWASFVESGKMRVLAVWNERREPRFPDMPTMKELGYDLVMISPFGIGAPAGLDPQVASKLGAAFKQAILSKEFKVEADKILAPVMYQDAETFRKFVQENYEWEKAMIERIKLKDRMRG